MTKSKPFQNSMLIVLSGPSGVGKDAVLSRMKESLDNYHFTVTATTREIREGEIVGRDYDFLSRDQFEKLVSTKGFIEWSEVYGNLYGVPKSQVINALNEGKHVVVKIDVQGARKIQALAPDAIFIFLSPPSMESLESRLTQRMTEAPEALAIRLSTAKLELLESKWFNYTVVNEDDMIEQTVHRIKEIVKQELLLNRNRTYFIDTGLK